MYKIVYTNRMKKDVRLMKKRGKDIGKLTNLCIKSLRILLFFRLPQPAVMRICLESKILLRRQIKLGAIGHSPDETVASIAANTFSMAGIGILW